jgi:hypothetical protein
LQNQPNQDLNKGEFDNRELNLFFKRKKKQPSAFPKTSQQTTGSSQIGCSFNNFRGETFNASEDFARFFYSFRLFSSLFRRNFVGKRARRDYSDCLRPPAALHSAAAPFAAPDNFAAAASG